MRKPFDSGREDEAGLAYQDVGAENFINGIFSCAILRRTSAAALCLASLGAAPARAGISDTIHPYVLVSINHDDNLLRETDDTPGEKSDTYKTAEAGMSFERPIGRQILSGRAKVTKVTFDRYQLLDYNGKDFLGALDWRIGSQLRGHVGGQYTQTLAPQSDFHSDQRNTRIVRHGFTDATWLMHPSWQLRGSVTRDRYTYDLDAQKFNNRTEDTSELGVDYLSTTTSRVGLVLRKIKGEYTDRNGITSLLLDNGFTQDEFKLNVLWYVSGSTQLQFLGGVARRKHAVFSERDESGANGRLVYDWTPRGRTHFTAKLWREFAAVEGTLLNSSLNKGGSLDATYDLAAKVGLTAGARSERRNFSTLPGVVSTDSLSDSSRSLSAGVVYSPLQLLQLGLNAFHEARSGNPRIGTNSYKANGISFNVSAQF